MLGFLLRPDVLLGLTIGIVLICANLALARHFHRHRRALIAQRATKIPVAWQTDPALNGSRAWIEMGRRCPELLGVAADRVLGRAVVDSLLRQDLEELARRKAARAPAETEHEMAISRKHDGHGPSAPSSSNPAKRND